MEPIGRNDALVPVCSECATETPIATFAPEMAYEPDDRMPTWIDSRVAKAPAATWSGGMGLEHEPGRWVGAKRVDPSKSNAAREERRRRAAARNGGGK